MKKIIRIVIINQPLCNRGDEAAHKALVRAMLKEMPEARIQIPFPKRSVEVMKPFVVANERVEYIPVSLYRGITPLKKLITHRGWLWLSALHPALHRYLSLMRHADWIVNAPGGICLGGFQNWNHLMFLMMAHHSKTPIAYVGRSIGPFPVDTVENQIFRERSRQMLQELSFLSLRDGKSEVYAKEMGASYVRTIDSAYLDTPQVEIPAAIGDMIGGKDYMVFVPNLLIWHYQYRNRISKENVILFFRLIAESIMQRFPELKIVMLPQTYGYGTYHGDDINIFREIAAAINDERVVVVPDCYDSDVQQCIIRQARFLVGARYHSIVFAVNNSVPFVALSYEHKIVGMLTDLGKQDRCIDIIHSLDSEDSIRETLEVFNQKLSHLSPDPDARDRAKNLCQSGLAQLKALMKK